MPEDMAELPRSSPVVDQFATRQQQQLETENAQLEAGGPMLCNRKKSNRTETYKELDLEKKLEGMRG